jgi:hypothetical protein
MTSFNYIIVACELFKNQKPGFCLAAFTPSGSNEAVAGVDGVDCGRFDVSVMPQSRPVFFCDTIRLPYQLTRKKTALLVPKNSAIHSDLTIARNELAPYEQGFTVLGQQNHLFPRPDKEFRLSSVFIEVPRVVPIKYRTSCIVAIFHWNPRAAMREEKGLLHSSAPFACASSHPSIWERYSFTVTVISFPRTLIASAMPQRDGSGLPILEVFGKSFNTLSDKPNPLPVNLLASALGGRLVLVIISPPANAC